MINTADIWHVTRPKNTRQKMLLINDRDLSFYFESDIGQAVCGVFF